MDNKRRESRLPIQLDVELHADDNNESELQTRDLSSSGVYLEKGTSNLPPEGTIVHLRIKNSLGDGDPPLVKARVVRVDKDGLALVFITDD
ncbi:hypothetical protein MNBD_GAMMA21-2863 [hydrothermal vent metagenome]|uniref:PilZ domain-containing protein n=1 Tax=hydrothermal vent metagenome TaxID=652676 RepID=A0A3B1AYG8_9ZZZZ